MVTSPKAVLRGYDWLDTLAHEYTHLVVTQTGHNSVPIWLQEAMAKYLESRWRGPAGKALPPSSRALLAERVQKNDLIPFAKMHPSMAKLPTWKDAATAFAEVFFAAEYLHKEHGMRSLRTIVETMGAGATDQQAVEKATGKSFPAFEKGWMAYLQIAAGAPVNKPPATSERPILKGKNTPPEEGQKGREISFGEFDEVENPAARRWAHLGELFRERGRFPAAAEEYGKAHALVGSAYETISNKYALALMAVKRLDGGGEGAARLARGTPRLRLDAGPPRAHLPEPWPVGRGQVRVPVRAGARTRSTRRSIWRCSSPPSRSAMPRWQTGRGARRAVLTGLPADRLPELLARLPGPQSDPVRRRDPARAGRASASTPTAPPRRRPKHPNRRPPNGYDLSHVLDSPHCRGARRRPARGGGAGPGAGRPSSSEIREAGRGAERGGGAPAHRALLPRALPVRRRARAWPRRC